MDRCAADRVCRVEVGPARASGQVKGGGTGLIIRPGALRHRVYSTIQWAAFAASNRFVVASTVREFPHECRGRSRQCRTLPHRVGLSGVAREPTPALHTPGDGGPSPGGTCDSVQGCPGRSDRHLFLGLSP